MIIDFFVSTRTLFVTETILLIILVLLFLINFRKIIGFFNNFLNKKDYIFILLLFIFSLFVRFYYFGNFHYSNDEYMYIESARELYNFQQVEGFSRVIGWPYLLFIVFSIFGFYSIVGFIFSIFIGSISVITLYLIIKLIFEDKNISIFSSLLFSILPFHIFWSGNLETSIISLFFILNTILFYLIFNKTNDFNFFYISIFLTVFTTTTRAENTFIYILLFILFLVNIKIFLKDIKKFLFSIFLFSLGFFLAFSNYVNQYFFTNSQDWNYGNGGNIGLHNLPGNIKYFLTGFFNNKLFIFYDFIAALGVLYLFYLIYLFLVKKKNTFNLINLWLFLSFFIGLYVVYNFIWLKFIYGVDRLYLMVYPIYILFFGLGISFLLYISLTKLSKYYKYIFIVLLLLTISNIFSTSSYKFNSVHHELQMRVSNDFKNIYSDKCLYVVYKTFYYSGYLKSFNYTYIYEFNSNNLFQEQIFNNFSCVIFIDDKFCNDSSPGNNFRGPDGVPTMSYCNKLKNDFSLTPVKTYNLDGVTYGYYNIIKK